MIGQIAEYSLRSAAPGIGVKRLPHPTQITVHLLNKSAVGGNGTSNLLLGDPPVLHSPGWLPAARWYANTFISWRGGTYMA